MKQQGQRTKQQCAQVNQVNHNEAVQHLPSTHSSDSTMQQGDMQTTCRPEAKTQVQQ